MTITITTAMTSMVVLTINVTLPVNGNNQDISPAPVMGVAPRAWSKTATLLLQHSVVNYRKIKSASVKELKIRVLSASNLWLLTTQ